MTRIDKIKEEILQYHQMSFDTEEEDYKFNKSLKEKLQQVIIDFEKDEDIVLKALVTLAEMTGCAEDYQIAEDILDYLYNKNHISKEQLDFFYKHTATTRWL